MAAISALNPEEIELLALNLSGKRKGVSGAWSRLRKDRVYLVDAHPALVNGKGIEEGVTIYDYEFCSAVLTQASDNGEKVAIALRDFFATVGGLNAWIQTVTGWREYFGVDAMNASEISYRQLEAELMWEELGRTFMDEEEREGEYAIYFGVRPMQSMQICLPSEPSQRLMGLLGG